MLATGGSRPFVSRHDPADAGFAEVATRFWRRGMNFLFPRLGPAG